MMDIEKRKVWNEAMAAAITAIHDYVGLSEDEKRIVITVLVKLRTDDETLGVEH